MTRGILEKYIAYRGMRLYKGDAPSTQVFIPFLIMDCAYQIFSSGPLRERDRCRFGQRKWLKFTDAKFLHFFTEFNRPFTADELDAIGEDQDAFAEFVRNELMYLKVAIANGCPSLSLERQLVVADTHLVNILSACAGVFWEDTFHSRSLSRGDRNTDIDGVRCGTRNFAAAYVPENTEFAERDVAAVRNAQSALCRRIVEFVNKHQRMDGN